MTAMPEIVELSADQLACHADELAEILIRCVEGEAGVGFLLPLPHEEARAFWLGYAPAVARGACRIFAAIDGGRCIGTV